MSADDEWERAAVAMHTQPLTPTERREGAEARDTAQRLAQLEADCERKTAELVRLERRNRELEERLAKIRETVR